jgi:multisubunit Na+/H+ antiporter MnhG subunit
MGAMGKSAQFLLHTWLPDAMEGPTPVSALIHAATMVTAGVFMVARLSPLFELAPVALQVVTLVGAVTAFFAATVGLVQNDIKRVVAYSTCSQLGYMFVAMGVGAYSVGMFHLFTHAFFKALLFLGSGSVIMAMVAKESAASSSTPKSVAGLAILLLILAAFFGFLNTQKMKALRVTVATAQAARDATERRIHEKLNTSAGGAVEEKNKVTEVENRATKAEAELAQTQNELDVEKRARATHALAQRLYDESRGVMLGMRSLTWAVSKKVNSWPTLVYVPLENNYEYVS